MDKQEFGTYLRNLRKERKLSQEELSAILGIKRQTYSTYETGRIFPPTDILIALSKHYETSLESFIGAKTYEAPKFGAATLLYDSKSFEKESELLTLFRNVELRDQEDILDFLKLKSRQYRNNVTPRKYL